MGTPGGLPSAGEVFDSGFSESGLPGKFKKAAEKQLTLQNLQLAQQQLSNLAQQQDFQAQLFDLLAPQLQRQALETEAFNKAIPVEDQADFFRSQFEAAISNQAAADELLQFELENLRRGGVASPEQAAIIDQIAAQELASGSSDINNFVGEGLGQISDQLANARGLRFGDTPILDRGQLLAREGLRLKSQLGNDISARALTGKLTGGQFISGAAQQQQQLSTAISQFQNQLQNASQSARSGQTFNTANLGANLSSFFDPTAALGTVKSRSPSAPGGLSAGSQALVGFVSGIGGGIGQKIAGCWVAAEYFGWFTPKWFAARNWIFNIWDGPDADRFREFYTRNGEEVARLIRSDARLRETAWPLFRHAAENG